MKIKVPKKAIALDLSDREMLFVNLICQFLHHDLENSSDVVVDTEFYFYEDDIKKIVKKHHSGMEGPAFDKLREVLQFKLTVNGKYAVTLKDPAINIRGVRKGSMTMDWHVLKDQRAIQLYFYLIGITSVQGVVKEFARLKDIPRNLRVMHNKLVHVYTN